MQDRERKKNNKTQGCDSKSRHVCHKSYSKDDSNLLSLFWPENKI